MNFTLGEEQQMLKQVVRDFLAQECPPSHVRAMAASESGFSLDLWRRITELGWTALAVPERFGGQGGTLVDLAVLFEEVGRVLLPSPLFATVALAAVPLARAEGAEALRERVLPAVARGELRLTAGLFELEGGYDIEAVTTAARTVEGGYALSGIKAFVLDAAAADAILVLARKDDGERSFFFVERGAPGVKIEPVATLDWGRQHIVRLEDVRVGAEDEIRGLAPEVVFDCATAVLCAEMVGAAERAMEMAVEWGKTRIQFGRPIGSFQAVSHKCADMLVGVESGRSLAYYACLALDEGRSDARAAVSAAKAYLSDVFPWIAEACLQIHGGMGYTWEHDAHLYLRRARAAEVRFGDAEFHRERLLAAIGW